MIKKPCCRKVLGKFWDIKNPIMMKIWKFLKLFTFLHSCMVKKILLLRQISEILIYAFSDLMNPKTTFLAVVCVISTTQSIHICIAGTSNFVFYICIIFRFYVKIFMKISQIVYEQMHTHAYTKIIIIIWCGIHTTFSNLVLHNRRIFYCHHNIHIKSLFSMLCSWWFT